MELPRYKFKLPKDNPAKLRYIMTKRSEKIIKETLEAIIELWNKRKTN